MTEPNEGRPIWPAPIDLSTIKALPWPELRLVDALLITPAPLEELELTVRHAKAIVQLAGMPAGARWFIIGPASAAAAAEHPVDELKRALAMAGVEMSPEDEAAARAIVDAPVDAAAVSP